jgi:hypothetical protein
MGVKQLSPGCPQRDIIAGIKSKDGEAFYWTKL